VAGGATVVLSSYELDRAEVLAHRVVHLAGGTTDAALPTITAADDEEPLLVP
jgi:hypothetical protein